VKFPPKGQKKQNWSGRGKGGGREQTRRIRSRRQSQRDRQFNAKGKEGGEKCVRGKLSFPRNTSKLADRRIRQEGAEVNGLTITPSLPSGPFTLEHTRGEGPQLGTFSKATIVEKSHYSSVERQWGKYFFQNVSCLRVPDNKRRKEKKKISTIFASLSLKGKRRPSLGETIPP